MVGDMHGDATSTSPGAQPSLGSPRAPLPRASSLSGLELAAFTLCNCIVIAAMWVGHGGLDQLRSLAGLLTATGQLTGLYGAFAILVQLVLVARVPWIERRYGMPQLNVWHRWLGFSAILLLTTHAVTITIGYAISLGMSPWTQLVELVRSYPNMLGALVGFVLMVGVAVTSARAVRRAVSYETWWFIHLYAYLGIALAFAHQLSTGADFVADPLARVYWVGLYVLVAVLLIGFRWIQPFIAAVRRNLRVAEVTRESPDVISLEITGRGLDRLRCEAGQFFLLRFLTADRWWKAHPFSLSTAPDGRRLRFTIKTLGDDSAQLQAIAIGTRVAADGPYGTFTAARAEGRKVLLIAGGVGVTPIRALYEGLDRGRGETAVLYRARCRKDAVLSKELRELSDARSHQHVVSYSRPFGRRSRVDPLRPEWLEQWLPDLCDRAVYVCGPPSLIAAARSSLRSLGLPQGQIHSERFDY